MMTRRNGFTLIELLVVIAIIAILAENQKPFNTLNKVVYVYYPWMIQNMLRPYTRNDRIFICPSAAGPTALERYARGFLCTWVYRVKDLGDTKGMYGGLDRGLGGYKDDFDKNPRPMSL